MKRAEDQPIRSEMTDNQPEKAKKTTRKTAGGADRRGGTAKSTEVQAKAAKKTAGKTQKVVRTVPIGDDWPEEKGDLDAGVRKKSAAARADSGAKGQKNKTAKASHTTGTVKRAKARKPNEKITPASIFNKMLKFGKAYQIENEQDFIEAARIYAEEAYLISQMRDQIAEEGLTVLKTYKTGDVPVAHPLLSELPRHVESANKCLGTIGNMISDRGAKKQKPTRELDQFRLNA